MEFSFRDRFVPVRMRSGGLLPHWVDPSKPTWTTETKKEEKRKTQLAAPRTEISSSQTACEFSETLSQTSGESSPETEWISIPLAA